jgi:hypothetical protein
LISRIKVEGGIVDPYETDPVLHLLNVTTGTPFFRAEFVARVFHTPYENCESCAIRILERPKGDGVNKGYVRLIDIKVTPESQDLRWQWLCEACFVKYQAEAHLPLAEGPIGNEMHERYRAHLTEFRKRLESEDPLVAERYEIETVWRPEQLVWMASSRGVELSTREASELLWKNRYRLKGAMDAIAHELIVRLVDVEGAKKRGVV